MFHSVYRKDGDYYPEVSSEKFIHNFFLRNIRNFGFWGFESSSRNIRSVLGFLFPEI